LNFVAKDPEPELLFTDLTMKTRYKILIRDVAKPKISKLNTRYITFVARLVAGFEGYSEEFNYIVHFPYRAFKLAWDKAPDYRAVDSLKVMDCIVTFKRLTKKKMVIYKREYYECGTYNETEVTTLEENQQIETFK